jgi:broad specificity phosphatase PhoE
MLPTTFLLVRHAQHDYRADALAGRLPKIYLSAEGRQQAGKLAKMLATLPVHAVYSSPLERTCETAQAIADCFGLPVQISEALNEIDFGDWTGKTFQELSSSQAWQQWNALRSRTRTANGESMLEAQERIVAALEGWCVRHAGELVVVVSHADVIRAALAHYLSVPVDLFLRIQVNHASVSAVRLGNDFTQVLCLNSSVSLDAMLS